jgi:hypothetical protein
VGQITWNHALQSWYSNLLILVELAHVQCVSTTTCERAFSVQIWSRLKLEIGWVVEISRQCCKLPWKTKWGGRWHYQWRCPSLEEWQQIPCFLYANPSFYLNYPKTPSVSDVSCTFDTNNNGTQISWLSILTILWKILGSLWMSYFWKATSLALRWQGLCRVQLLLRLLFTTTK